MIEDGIGYKKVIKNGLKSNRAQLSDESDVLRYCVIVEVELTCHQRDEWKKCLTASASACNGFNCAAFSHQMLQN